MLDQQVRRNEKGGAAPETDDRAGPRLIHGATRELMLAVLEDGIRTYLGTSGSEQSEAEIWIQSTNRSSTLCFTVICETLGIDPSSARSALGRMRATAQSRRFARRRFNARRHAGVRSDTEKVD